MYSIGQRVGIVSGVQAVGGPTVTAYGTVTAVETFWTDTLEYQVTPDDGSEALWYREYLLRPVPADVPMGPVCAACGDATCTAQDAHHTVTGTPTNVAPYFREANRARSEATDNDDQVANLVAEREAWLDQVIPTPYVAPVVFTPGSMPDVAADDTYEAIAAYDTRPTMRDVWSSPEVDKVAAQDRYIEQGHAYLQASGHLPTH